MPMIRCKYRLRSSRSMHVHAWGGTFGLTHLAGLYVWHEGGWSLYYGPGNTLCRWPRGNSSRRLSTQLLHAF